MEELKPVYENLENYKDSEKNNFLIILKFGVIYVFKMVNTPFKDRRYSEDGCEEKSEGWEDEDVPEYARCCCILCCKE